MQNEAFYDCFKNRVVFSDILFCDKNILIHLQVEKKRRQEVMRHFLKGAAVVVVVIIIDMIVHIVCNMHGIDLSSVPHSALSALFAVLFYQRLIKNEKNNDEQK